MRQIDFRYDLLPLKNRLFRLALRITLDHAEAEDGNIDHVKTFPRRGAIQIEIIIARFFPECKQIS